MLLLLVGTIVFFAPIVIGRFGFWKQVLPLASPALAKQVNIASLQLGWFSPIEVRGLVIKDGDQPLAELPLIRSRKTLLAIALNSKDVGTFEVDRPKAKLVPRRGGSNVEDFLAKLPKSQGGTSNVGVGLVLSGGTLEFDDKIAGHLWKVDNAAVEIHSPASSRETKSGKLSADVKSAADDSVAGQVTAEFAGNRRPAKSLKPPASAGHAHRPTDRVGSGCITAAGS